MPKEEIQHGLNEYTDLKKIINETLPILLLSLIGSLVAGIYLGGMEKSLEIIPGLIVVIPAMLDMRGNIYGALGSKLSTGLHQGLIEPKYIKDENLVAALGAALFNSAIISAISAVFAWSILMLLNKAVISIIELTLITLIAGTLSGLILTLIVTVTAFTSYKRGLDPDNVIGPVVTVSGDIFSIIILFEVANTLIGVI